MSSRRSAATICSMLIASLCATAQAASVVAPGGTIDKAIGVDVTPQGLDFLLDQGMALVPDLIQTPDATGSQSFGCTVNYHAYPGQATNGVHVTIGTANVVPQDGGYFSLSITGSVIGNGTDTPPSTSTQNDVVTRLEYSGCLTNCTLGNSHYAVIRLTPMPFSVTTRLNLVLSVDGQGNPHVTANTPLTKDDITIDTSKFDAAGCAAVDFAVAIAKNFIGDTVKQKIVDQVNQTLIPAIQQGFESVRFDQDLSLAGTTLHAKLQPSGLVIANDGVLLSMSSAIDATTPTTCIPVGAGDGSAFTDGSFPAFGTTSPSGLAFDAAAGISDDLANQALFAAWHGGLLCRTIDTLGGSPLTTSVLAIAGLTGPLNRLGVADGTPMLIVLKAYNPPLASFGGAHAVNVDIKKLEVSIFTEVQERMARLVALDLDATAGVDLTVDANNQLNVALNIDPAAMVGTIAYGEPLGDDANGLLALLPVLAGQLGPQLAGAIPPINLGNLAGVALTNPEFIPQQSLGGVPNDTLSIYTGLSAAPGGCTAANPSGCGVGSGTGGCDTVSSRRAANGAGVWLALALAPLAFLAVRRRRG